MAEFDTYYAEDYRAWGQVYPAMAEDLRYYLGDQWTLEEQKALREEGRHFYTFNKVKSKIDWVNGWQIQNRLSPVVLPIQTLHQQAADDLTECLLYVFDKYHGYRGVSETFGAGNKTGWGLLNIYSDFTSDPVNGDVQFARDPYSGFILSAYFTKLDLSDCDHVIKRKYISPSVAATLLPGQEDDVMSLARDGWERDNKFTWMVFQRVPTGQRMMAYNEFFRMKFQPQEVIVNRTTGMFVDYDGKRETLEFVKQQADQFGHNIDIISRKRKFIEKHIVLNNYYMRTEINPYGLDEYPFALYSPILEPESEEFTYKVQSLVRQIKDPQRELNRRRSQMIDIVESQLNSGWIEEDNAVKNPQMLYQSGQGKRIVLNDGKTISSIQRIEPAVVPPTFFQETSQAESDLMEILGMNPTIFGHVETKQVSALVEMQRQKAGLMAQEEIFDRLVEFQSSIAMKVVKMVQQWSPDKVRKILGREPAQDFFDKDLSKYHVTVSEGILTPTQKYMFFRQLLELKELGEPIPPGELTKEAPLQGKTEFLKSVQKYQQQLNQQMQQQQQAAMQQEEAVSQSLQAKAISDIALSKERQTRALANLGLEEERNSESVQNRERAALDHVKAMKELEIMDAEHKQAKDSRLMEMFDFFQRYEQYLKGEVDQKTEKQKDIVK